MVDIAMSYLFGRKGFLRLLGFPLRRLEQILRRLRRGRLHIKLDRLLDELAQAPHVGRIRVADHPKLHNDRTAIHWGKLEIVDGAIVEHYIALAAKSIRYCHGVSDSFPIPLQSAKRRESQLRQSFRIEVIHQIRIATFEQHLP